MVSVPTLRQKIADMIHAICLAVLLVFPASACAQRSETEFDWTNYRVSAIDLILASNEAFEHGQPFLTTGEMEAYLGLLGEVDTRRRRLLEQAADDMTGQWESAFYEFAHAREKAWQNGGLRRPRGLAGADLSDPFRAPGQPTTAELKSEKQDLRYGLLRDIGRFPEHFVGRPVVVYGLYQAQSTVKLQRSESFPGSRAKPTTLVRGFLKSASGREPFAVVDTRGLLIAESGMHSIDDWPHPEQPVEVLVKGWVVKLWDGRPLIYCESLRKLGAKPFAEQIRKHTEPMRRIQDSESWLYYETLQQLEVASRQMKTLRAAAQATLLQRIDQLMLEVEATAKARVAEAERLLRQNPAMENEYRIRKTRIQRQLAQRVGRYRGFRKDPSKFDTYVDLFEHSEQWQGKLVTLQGHVRHVVSYDGDETLFAGRRLHELWLFTDDSQHNPAVIITPNLPRDFPTKADVINRVSVTGCYFKRYVYGSQKDDRIAPLILAGSVQWSPTADQIESLVASGFLSDRSPTAASVLAIGNNRLAGIAPIFFAFFAALLIMILWGRWQRETRDRRRLLNRLNQDPEFENERPSDYLPELPEFYSDLD